MVHLLISHVDYDQTLGKMHWEKIYCRFGDLEIWRLWSED